MEGPEFKPQLCQRSKYKKTLEQRGGVHLRKDHSQYGGAQLRKDHSQCGVHT